MRSHTANISPPERIKLDPETLVEGRRADRAVVLSAAEGDLSISMDALEACFRWSQGGSLHGSLRGEVQGDQNSHIRKCLVYQLNEVDW